MCQFYTPHAGATPQRQQEQNGGSWGRHEQSFQRYDSNPQLTQRNTADQQSGMSHEYSYGVQMGMQMAQQMHMARGMMLMKGLIPQQAMAQAQHMPMGAGAAGSGALPGMVMVGGGGMGRGGMEGQMISGAPRANANGAAAFQRNVPDAFSRRHN